MAIMAQGEIVAQGAPSELIAQLDGRVWSASADKSSLADYQDRHTVISTRRIAGTLSVHVLADERPEDAFSPVTPTLEGRLLRDDLALAGGQRGREPPGSRVMSSFLSLFRFELRYQVFGPTFVVSFFAFFLLAFFGTASEQVQIGGPSSVNLNAPSAIALTTRHPVGLRALHPHRHSLERDYP